MLEIEKNKFDFEDFKNKSKIEFELISSSLFEITHQYMELKNKNNINSDKTKTKNWLDIERTKIFPLDNK